MTTDKGKPIIRVLIVVMIALIIGSLELSAPIDKICLAAAVLILVVLVILWGVGRRHSSEDYEIEYDREGPPVITGVTYRRIDLEEEGA